MRVTASRRQKRDNEEVGIVRREDEDDDVFITSPMSPQTKNDRWPGHSIENEMPSSNHENIQHKKHFNETTTASFTPASGQHCEEKTFDKTVSSGDHEIAPTYLHCSPNLPTTPNLDTANKCIPTAMRLPPLLGDRLSSGNQTPRTPLASPGSSNLSENRIEVRTRSSTKRVAFAEEISQEVDSFNIPTSPKCKKMQEEPTSLNKNEEQLSESLFVLPHHPNSNSGEGIADIKSSLPEKSSDIEGKLIKVRWLQEFPYYKQK